MADFTGTNRADTLNGTSAADRLYGLGGNDNLNGGAGSDELYGGDGDDILHGDAGADLMLGGAGNDTYYVDDINDIVSEETVTGIDDGGTDRVYTTVSYTLRNFIERATLISTTAGDLTGNAQANTLTGNDAVNILTGLDGADTLVGNGGNDTLIGGAGADILTGGTGADKFVFGPADATSTDKINDFAAEDRFGITASDYGLTFGNGLIVDGSGAVALDTSYFATITGKNNVQGTVAGHGQFLYNTSSNKLLWDADGSGSAAGITLAALNAGAPVTASSFAISGVSAPVVGNISVNDVSVTEGDAGTKLLTFTISRTGQAAGAVDFTTANGSATAGSDYIAQSGTVNFALGQTSQTVTITINGDTAVETDETFFINLSNATNGGVITDAQGQGTILNNDAVGNISINDVSVTEGDAGTKLLTFTVTRTGNGDGSVSFNTADGTATAGSDYAAQSGTINFAAGQASQTISIVINGDTTAETDETLLINLSNATNGGVITDGQGQGTILNDDSVGSISINDVSVAEGDAGTKQLTFTVTRTGTAPGTVDFVTADGTATAGSDYAAASGTVIFAAGQASQTISITINGDTAVEANETFFVNLSNATNGGVIIDAQGQGTILNDDSVGNISIDDVSVTEGDAGTKLLTFTVSRTGQAAGAVDFVTADDTATAGSDYIAQSGTANFAFGQMSQTVTITVNGDTVIEGDETFLVNLSNATNGGVITDAQGQGTILNDDSVGNISIDDVSITEGDAGTKLLTFTVSRTGQAAGAVDFATTNGSASAGTDYVAQSGTVTFSAGQASQTISIVINGDTTPETNENFFVNLSNATNGGVITDAQGVGTITNDDAAPANGSFSISDVIVVEGDSGTRTAIFTITHAGPAAASVDFATADGTAAAGIDYVATSGTINFAAGQATQTLTVTLNGDTSYETNETFFIDLSNASPGVTILDGRGQATIVNEDSAPLIADQTSPSTANDYNGTDSNNKLIGTDLTSATERFYAKGGDDVIMGKGGSDLLDGMTGMDNMFGGAGDDVYRVDSYGDVVSEESTGFGIDDGGSDTVESTISYTLGSFVEKLTLTPATSTTAPINGTGNALANIIKGNESNNVLSGMGGADDLRGNGGNDTLVGGAGKDILTGGTGNDAFVLGPADVSSTDRIVDFTSGADVVRIFAADYGLSEGNGLTGGLLSSSYFAQVTGIQGTVAGHGQFLYNTTTRTLMWDADGSATSAAGIALATFDLVNGVAVNLTASDIAVITTTPTVSAVTATPEAQSEGKQIFFSINISEPSNQDIFVHYSTVNGTASNSDYSGITDGVAVIAAGSTSAIVSITALRDTAVELSPETFSLQLLSANLANGAAITINNTPAVGTISDAPEQVLNIIDTRAMGSVDPSGLAYVPGLGLFLSDSEVDETPYFRTNNLFLMNLDGSNATGISLLNFTHEPTGLSFDAATNRLYISDDDLFKVFWVNPANPTVKLGEFAVPVAADDPEDIAVNPANGNIFIVNGLSHSIVESNLNGVQVGPTIVLPAEITDPEALVYDAQHDWFYVGGDFSNKIWRVDHSGNILKVIDVLTTFTNPVTGTRVHVKDLEFAPTSNPNDDPHLQSLYVADYGNSHYLDSAPLNDDGRIFEINLGFDILV